MRRHLPLTGIVLLAAILRLGVLRSGSLWLDEGAECGTIFRDQRCAEGVQPGISCGDRTAWIS